MLSVVSDNNTMAATTSGMSKSSEISKAEYLKRYLSEENDAKKSKGKIKKKRRKVPGKGWVCWDLTLFWRLAWKLAEATRVDQLTNNV